MTKTSLARRPAALSTALIAGGALLLVAAGFLHLGTVRLNEDLAHDVHGYITSPALTGDGSRVVYLAGLQDDQVLELFVSPADGSGGAVRLSGTLVAGGDVQSFLIAPGGGRVFYRADQDVDGLVEFYSAPIDGSLAPVKLNGNLVSGGFVRSDLVSVSPDSARVLYVASQEVESKFELFSVPIGGGAAVKLNGTLIAQGDIQTASISPGSDWVAYTADQITNDRFELFGVPIGGGTAVKLNTPLAAFSVGACALAAAPGVPRVVYAAQQDVAGRNELYSVPSDGSQLPTKLNEPFASGTDLSNFVLAPGGARVLYLTSAGTLFGVPVDGSQAAVRLDSPRPANIHVESFRITADGSRAVYWTFITNVSSESTDLYAVPIDGSASATRLSVGVSGTRVPYSPMLAPDGTHLVYSHRSGPSTLDLYGAPLDGSALPVKLNGAYYNLGQSPTSCAFDSSSGVLFLGQVAGGDALVLRAPLDGSSAPLAVSAFESRIGPITSFQLSANRSRALFTSRQPPAYTDEIFSFSSDGQTPAVRVNDPLPFGPYQGDVAEFVLTGDASTAVYAAPQDLYGYAQVHAAPTDGSSAPRRLEAEIGIASNLVLTPDGASVLYVFRPYFDNPFLGARVLRLAHLDGIEPPLELAGPLLEVANPLITPDSARVLFRNIDFYGDATLYSLELGGSSAGVRLDDVNVQTDLALSPDGDRVFYRRGPAFASAEPTETELWVTAVDGSSAPVVLNDALPTNGGVSSFALTPEGERVVYRANQNALSTQELFSTLADGTGPSLRLNGALVTNGNVTSMAVARSGPYVVYRADQAIDERYEIYRVPNDESSAPVRLNPTLVTGGDVNDFVISPDGTRVVYLADQVTNDVFELYSVALDGSAPAVRISAPMVAGGDVASYQIAPDSRSVVYVADQRVNDVAELFNVPLAGGAVLRSSPDLVSGGNVSSSSVTVSADSHWVVYLADANVDGVNELFRAPIDRSGIPERLSGRLVQGGSVGGLTPPFRVGPDGQTVVFTSDALQDEVFELFSAVSRPFRIRER